MLNYNPKKHGIEDFEPGCIVCAGCGYRPESCWDPTPEEPKWVEYENIGQYECDYFYRNEVMKRKINVESFLLGLWTAVILAAFVEGIHYLINY